MSETAQPRVATQYPHSDPMVLTAPLNVPVAIDTLVNNSAAVADLQTQLTALAARVTALENAVSAEALPS